MKEVKAAPAAFLITSAALQKHNSFRMLQDESLVYENQRSKPALRVQTLNGSSCCKEESCTSRQPRADWPS